MTNAEKYLKDGVDIMQMLHDYNQTGQKCNTVWKWLEQEVKPTLTKGEKFILRNLDNKFKYIKRSNLHADLYIIALVDGAIKLGFSEYNHLFQFIQPRRRI